MPGLATVVGVVLGQEIVKIFAENPHVLPFLPLQYSKPEARVDLSNSSRIRPSGLVALGVRNFTIWVTPKDRYFVIFRGDRAYRSSGWCFSGGERAFWEK